MRLIVTADLHFNHARSRPLAEELIGHLNRLGGDVLMVVGDTASGDGDALEQCLGLFSFRGPKLFICGNHELWTGGDDSRTLFRESLPRRVVALGWQWLEDAPFVQDEVAIVGSVGWYDYSFAVSQPHIPRRYYEAKVSPGVAQRYSDHAALIHGDEPPETLEIFARWNDGRFVHLHESDEEFLEGRLRSLQSQLEALRDVKAIVAGIHHVPFAQLLPPHHGTQWDFARAYLGSGRIGEALLKFENVRHVFCGHSHWPAEAVVGAISAVNIGSGYRSKTYRVVDLD